MKNAKMICGATFQPPQLPACVLPDSALQSLSEFTLFSENEGIFWTVEDGIPGGGFWDLAEQVNRASASAVLHLQSREARIVFALRNFYLLGVLRGGEAYRSMVLPPDEADFSEVPFTLCEEFSMDCIESLNDIPDLELETLLALLGLNK